mmetsp:Transcript_41691/g.47141  ORF Transcript_41691/g.47141 Transcript_41691/m.47141 type:complete len:99 (-) Transcript_41691:319-615(-)
MSVGARYSSIVAERQRTRKHGVTTDLSLLQLIKPTMIANTPRRMRTHRTARMTIVLAKTTMITIYGCDDDDDDGDEAKQYDCSWIENSCNGVYIITVT